MSIDIARSQVDTQLTAIGAAKWDVRIVDNARGGKPAQKMVFTTEQILSTGILLMLRGRNAGGQDIYIRPLPEPGSGTIVLLDDLDREKLSTLSEHVKPALTVETSPGNFQAWVRVGTDLTPGEHTALAKQMAERFGGDRGCADWAHVGRLAGFANRKPKHTREDGKHHFCRVDSVCADQSQTILVQDPELIEMARRTAQEQTHVQTGQATGVQTTPAQAGPKIRADYRKFYAAAMDEKNGDKSRADYAACIKLAAAGYKKEEMVAVLVLESEKCREKGPEYGKEYAERTAEKAYGYVRGQNMVMVQTQ